MQRSMAAYQKKKRRKKEEEAAAKRSGIRRAQSIMAATKSRSNISENGEEGENKRKIINQQRKLMKAKAA